MHFLSVRVFLLIRAFNLKVKRQTNYCKDETKMLKGIFQISFDFPVLLIVSVFTSQFQKHFTYFTDENIVAVRKH